MTLSKTERGNWLMVFSSKKVSFIKRGKFYFEKVVLDHETGKNLYRYTPYIEKAQQFTRLEAVRLSDVYHGEHVREELPKMKIKYTPVERMDWYERTKWALQITSTSWLTLSEKLNIYFARMRRVRDQNSTAKPQDILKVTEWADKVIVRFGEGRESALAQRRREELGG